MNWSTWKDDTSPCGATCKLKYFPKSSNQETFDISKDIRVRSISVPKKLHILFNEVTPKYRYQLWGKESTITTTVRFAWSKVTWTVGCAVNCWRDSHIRGVIWQTKSGFVSNGREEMNTRRARDSSRCGTVGVSSYTATFTVTGSHYTGANKSKFILMEEKYWV